MVYVHLVLKQIFSEPLIKTLLMNLRSHSNCPLSTVRCAGLLSRRKCSFDIQGNPFWVQGLEDFAGRLRAAGASFPVTGAAASAALLRGSAGDTGGSTGIVRVGAALYGQQEIVPGTRPAARWLTRIANLKQARPLTAVISWSSKQL